MCFLLHVSEDVFYDFLHEYTIVSLGGHTRVGRNDSIRDDAAHEETSTSSALTTDCCHVLAVPGDECLACAEGADLHVLFSSRVNEQIFGLVIAQIQYNRTR